MCRELWEANAEKATSRISSEILLSSCSSSEEVIVEGLEAKTGRRYIDEALTMTKREGEYFSRRDLAALLVVLLGFILIFSRVSPNIIIQLVGKS